MWRVGTTTGARRLAPGKRRRCVGLGLERQRMRVSRWSRVYFGTSGPQRIRVQVREDGVSIDQIVLSAARYFSTAPGPFKNDATVLPEVG